MKKYAVEFSQFSNFSTEFSDFSRVMISTRLGLDASFFSSVRFLIAKAIPGPSAIRYLLGVRPVIPFLTQGTPHPRGVLGWNLQLFCTAVFGWFLLILKQVDMKNE